MSVENSKKMYTNKHENLKYTKVKISGIRNLMI